MLQKISDRKVCFHFCTSVFSYKTGAVTTSSSEIKLTQKNLLQVNFIYKVFSLKFIG